MNLGVLYYVRDTCACFAQQVSASLTIRCTPLSDSHTDDGSSTGLFLGAVHPNSPARHSLFFSFPAKCTKVVSKVCKTRVLYNDFDPISLSEFFFRRVVKNLQGTVNSPPVRLDTRFVSDHLLGLLGTPHQGEAECS
jgi:hypothetical protein